MSNEPVKIGVLGCASIAIKSVIPAIQSLKSKFQLISVASRSEKKLLDLNLPNNVKRTVGYERLLEEPDLEAVYIPLPNSLHFEWIKKALKKNIHVIVEKSMACSLEEVKFLNVLANSQKLVLVENFQFRFHPQLQLIKDLLEKGEIGELRALKSDFGFPPFKSQNNIRYNRNLGGGALLDAGAYPIKISQILLGSDVEVQSASLYQDVNLGVDIWGGAFLKKKEGNQYAQIGFGFDNHYRCCVELWGSEGMLTSKRIFTAPSDLEVEVILENKNGKQIFKIEKSNHFIQMLNHFHVCLSNDDLRMTEYKENINQSKLVEELKNKSNG